ncbi:MAG TPA: hypothetical protein VGD94_04575 [Vicinamibacterales bacterium]
MATETPRGSSGRPRSWLLVLLGLAIVAYLATQMFSGPSVPAGVSTTAPRGGAVQAEKRVDPAELDVKLETLDSEPAGPVKENRNPFRFGPKTPVAPPASQSPPQFERPPSYVPPPPAPTGPRPIGELIKFIGIVDTGSERIGAFSDCRYTFSGREGEIIEGRFRVVRIGIESAVVEYLDGTGRTTLPLNGQACVGR